MDTLERRCYQIAGSDTAHLRRIDAMVEDTKLISPTVGTWPSHAVVPGGNTLHVQGAWNKTTSLNFVQKSTVLDVAMDRVRAKQRVAVVNAASAYQSGGGFKGGGRHALEESFCVQSSLYKSLE